MIPDRQTIEAGRWREPGDTGTYILTLDGGLGWSRPDAEHTDHSRGRVLTLAISGWRRHTRRTTEIGGGQNLDDLRALLAHETATLAQPRETLAALLAAWERWHLNDIRPGCDHQPEAWTCTSDRHGGPARSGPTGAYRVAGDGVLNGWPEVRRLYGEHPYPHDGYTCHVCGRHRWHEPSSHCPETGYRWGTAHLVEPLPEDVIALMRAAFPEAAYPEAD